MKYREQLPDEQWPNFVALYATDWSGIFNRLGDASAIGIYMSWALIYLSNPYALDDDVEYLFKISKCSRRTFNKYYERVRAEFNKEHKEKFLESRFLDTIILKAKTRMRMWKVAGKKSANARWGSDATVIKGGVSDVDSRDYKK